LTFLDFGISIAHVWHMPRMPLVHIPFGLYSVVSKCNNSEFIFDKKGKFEMYIRHVLACKKRLGFKLYDMVCMSNHIHELYRVPRNITIAQILHDVKGHFSRNYNEKFGRTGHLWLNKPFYRIVENEEYAFCTMDYFHMNPVRAGLVNEPHEWPYSGYRFHVLGDRKYLLSKLLDPLPYGLPQELSSNVRKAVEKVLKSKQIRYIGGIKFRRSMRKRRGCLE